MMKTVNGGKYDVYDYDDDFGDDDFDDNDKLGKFIQKIRKIGGET